MLWLFASKAMCPRRKVVSGGGMEGGKIHGAFAPSPNIFLPPPSLPKNQEKSGKRRGKLGKRGKKLGKKEKSGRKGKGPLLCPPTDRAGYTTDNTVYQFFHFPSPPH